MAVGREREDQARKEQLATIGDLEAMEDRILAQIHDCAFPEECYD